VTKLGSGHISEEYEGSKDSEYTAMMVKSLNAIKREKKPGTTTQCASTMANLERQKTRKPHEDMDWVLRPIDPSYLAVPDATNLEQLTGKRQFDFDQVMILSTKDGSKNSLGDGFKSSTSPEHREKAIHAFTYSKPYEPTDEERERMATPAELAEIKRLTNPIQAFPPEPRVSKWRKVWEWIKPFFGPNINNGGLR